MMIKRALLVALWCACAGALAPLTAGDDDCALHITGPGRTSAYDYSINLLKGNFGYDGQANCITYEAVNQAYLEARNRILVSQPKGDWKPEDFGSVGELILDISINLARRYGLTYEEIEKGLPLIDTSRTLIREVCPPVFSHVECRAGKYRRMDGLCNNLRHPTWGATMAPFQRLIGPLFADGINAPRIAHTGRDLPLSRVVSRTMHPDDGFHDHAGTVMVIAWGQFMDHDYTLTGTPLDPINRNDPEECCKRPQHLKHPYCNEIRIPDDDYFYRLFGVKCIDFVRGFPSPRPGCRLGSRTPFNTLTGAIDGNTVYGVTEKFSRKLRTGFGGLLRMNPVFKEYDLKDLLPLKLDIPDEGCTRPNKNMYCFEAGEIRVNEQLVLTVMHTLMAREHNRVAYALAEVNPHWDDETLFQEARRINIAEIQHITYNEFLPILLGKDVMEKFGLVLEKEGYWDGYDPEVNPDVLASFAAAAYRFGHSLLPTAVERWSKAHKFIASKRLSDLIRRPYDLYRAGVLDEYVMGLMNQVAQAMDDSITQEVTNHLFKKVGARFGMDLVSFNMQRGREFGLPGYMEFRKFCGLPGADSFQELFGSMSNHTVQKYETIFEHPIDVDLWSGGVSERPLPGSMLGPTFACIIATQFSYSRRGDRFWFELPNQPSSFTPEQMIELRKARLARVICDNTDIIDTVQLYPMVLPDHELNPRVPCRSGIIPSMDFSKWAEPAPFQGPAKQFITDAIIIEKNHTSSEDSKQEDKYEDTTLNVQQINACNHTDSANKGAIDCSVTLQAQNITNCSNAQNGSLLNDCNADKFENKGEHDIKTNEITDSDTVLKYVYKKNEKTDSNDKTKGHFKNSLTRKKRSPNSGNGEETASAIDANDEGREVSSAISDENDDVVSSPSSIKSAPLIVDYETNHRPRGRITWLTSRDNPNIIRGSDIDDFDLEALHERLRKDEEFIRNSGKHATEAEHLNDHNNDRDKYKEEENNDGRKNDREGDKSDERDSNREREDIPYPLSKENSRENIDHHSNNNSKYSSPSQDREREESRESIENEKPYSSSGESQEKLERLPKDHYITEENFKPREDSHESRGKEHYSQEAKPQDLKPYPNSAESKENLEPHPKSHYTEENLKPRDDKDDGHGKEHYRQEITPYHFKPYPNSGESKENLERHPKDHYTEEKFKPRDDTHDGHGKEHYRQEAKPYDIKPYTNSGESKESLERHPKDHYTEENFKPRSVIHDGHGKEHYRQEAKPYDFKPYPNNGESKENLERHPKDHYTEENFKSRDDRHDNSEKEHYRQEAKPYPNSGESKESLEHHPKGNYAEENFKSRDDRHNNRGKEHYRPEDKHYASSGESKENLERHPKDHYAGENFKSRDDRHDNRGKEHYRPEDKPYASSGESKESLERHPKDHYAGENFKSRDDRHDNRGKEHYRQEAKPYDLKPYPNSGESKESLERHPNDYYANENLKPHNDRHDNHGKEHYRQETKPYEPRSEEKSLENNERIYPSSESLGGNSKQSNEKIKPHINFHENYKNNHANTGNKSYPAPIQEVDLDDFSYEKIRLGKHGAVVPFQENFESVDPNAAVELLPPITSKPQSESQNVYQTINKDATTPTIENSKYSNEPININDGEIKPVVEISTENDSEENSKANLNTENEGKSLESLLGVKEIESTDQKDKLFAQLHQVKGDVKQQFERIPLNYKHKDDKIYNQKSESLSDDVPKEDNIDLPKNDGTLDVFTPNNVRYDENLNIKFDDIAVKLPEIKLPDDILEYARENSPFKDDINDNDEPLKSPFYNYKTEDNEEKEGHPPKDVNNRYNNEYRHKEGDTKDNTNDDGEVEDETEHGYNYKPYYEEAEPEKSQDYKKDEQNEDEEVEGEETEGDEDLYEKFVRERFGKQGTFEKRSEQLRDARETPINPKLYQTIQNILNKTVEIEKQAEKSGDPNAGYMWTLEYGENL